MNINVIIKYKYHASASTNVEAHRNVFNIYMYTYRELPFHIDMTVEEMAGGFTNIEIWEQFFLQTNTFQNG